jgi:hypothetical protein
MRKHELQFLARVQTPAGEGLLSLVVRTSPRTGPYRLTLGLRPLCGARRGPQHHLSIMALPDVDIAVVSSTGGAAKDGPDGKAEEELMAVSRKCLSANESSVEAEESGSGHVGAVAPARDGVVPSAYWPLPSYAGLTAAVRRASRPTGPSFDHDPAGRGHCSGPLEGGRCQGWARRKG